MKRAVLVTLFFLFSKNLSAAELTTETYWEGLKSSVTLLYQGSYMQFTAKNNLYYAGAAIPALWYSFEEDKRITSNAMRKRIPKYMQISSDLAPVLSFPIIPIAVFSLGSKYDNPKTASMGVIWEQEEELSSKEVCFLGIS
jgi:undecaprenyl-diphosphatase